MSALVSVTDLVAVGWLTWRRQWRQLAGDRDDLRGLWVRGRDGAAGMTARGYRRFRSHACGRQFSERSTGTLNRRELA